ncbi:MAG: hydantoinase B/oxoprolinase family protein [Lautropia sp.]
MSQPIDSDRGIDPIALEIFWTRIISAVDEAAAAFVRTSFSTVVREANDYAVILTDRTGRSVAQSTLSIPSFVATVPATIKTFIAEFGLDDMREGDAFITNDPWLATGHLNDATMAMPVFRDGRVIGFAGVVSHLPDIGGRLRNASNREIYEEGLQLPPVRFLHAGQVDELLIKLIRANVRVPEETVGDLWAQVACCRSLGDQLNALLDDSAIAFTAFCDESIERTERSVRQAIAAIPDGTYRSVIENDGPPEVPGGIVRLECAVTIAGDSIAVDYAGSTEQVHMAINTVLSYTHSYTAYALKTLLAPWARNNEGGLLPISVAAPEGSILNPRRPAPCGARASIGHLLPPAIYGALAAVIPDQVLAAPGSPSNVVQLANLGGSRRYSVNAFIGAGLGASSARDGLPAISFPSNLANMPIEVLESDVPVEVVRRSIRRGSGGRGMRNGGDGIVFELVMRGDAAARAAFTVNRIRCPAPGLNGGEAGAPARLEINGAPIDPAGQYVVRCGDRILVESAGGGGFGEPAEQQRERRHS